MPRLAGDIPYRLLGGGQPTQACKRATDFLANPQSKSHHNASVFFNGIDDRALTGNLNPQYDNTSTHMVWCAPSNLNPISDQTIYGVGARNLGLADSLDITIEAGGILSVSLYNSGGVIFQKKQIASEDTTTPGVDGFFFGPASWVQIVVTWDGATMTVYRNGLNMNSYMTSATDIGGTQANTLRAIVAGNTHNPANGNNFEGFIHSHAHWDTVLGQAEVSTIYNSGAGSDVDLNLGHGAYASTSSLKTWYKYGSTPSGTSQTNFAPTTVADMTSNLVPSRVRRTAPEGSFYRKDGAGTVGEASRLQSVGNAHTIAVWVKPTSLPAEGVTRDVWRVTNGVTNLDQIALSLTTSGGVSFWEYEFSNGAGTFNVLTGTTPVVVDEWYHILGCKQDTFSARFFVNGIDDLPPVIGGIVTTTDVSRSTHFGYDGRNFNPDQFDGDIHSVALWSVPVTENGIRTAYSGGWKNLDLLGEHPCYVEAASLEHWWVLGDPSSSLTHPAEDIQFPDRVPGGYSISTGQSGVGAEMRNRGIIETTLVGNCASFNDTSNLSMATALPLGLADSFTIAAWIKPEDLSSGMQYPLFIGPAQAGLSANEISFQIDADDAQEPLILQVTGPAGTVLQRVRYNNSLVQDAWQHITMVWDANAIQMYYNGTLVVPVVDTTSIGNATDTSRFIELGGSVQALAASAGLDFTGKLSHVGMWDKVLGDNEIRTVASQGHGLDLRYNKNDYVSGENLQHYYKMGEDTFLKGRDFMNTMRGTNISSMATETGTVTILGDAPGAEATVDGSLRSVLLDGATQYYLRTDHLAVGTDNAWTVSAWAKSDSSFPTIDTFQLFSIQSIIFPANAIRASLTGDGELTVAVNKSGGTALWEAQYNYVYTDNEWNHVIVRWDGTNIDVYINGYLEHPGFISIDNRPGLMDDGFVRSVAFGATNIGAFPWSGQLGHFAIFDSAINQANITEIFNGDHEIDLTNNFGDYLESSSLIHYYRPGFADEGFDDESLIATPLIDLDDSVGISINDIVIDAPPETVQGDDRSVLLGASDYYWQSVDQTYGFANQWSIGFWAKHNGTFPSSTQPLFSLGPTASFNSGIFIEMDGLGHVSVTAGKTLSAGTLWAGVWNLIFDDQDWKHVCVTWDGTTINLYRNGVFVPVSSTSLDARPGVMADDLRRCGYGISSNSVGSNWEGSLGHLGMWDTALTGPDLLEIFNGKHAMDLRQDVGSYNNSGDLVHYFRPGWNLGTNVGSGAGSGTTDQSTLAFNSGTKRDFINSLGITDVNVVEDAP